MSPTVAELLGSATALPALTLWQPWAFAVAELETILKKRGGTIAATAIETYMERGLS